MKRLRAVAMIAGSKTTLETEQLMMVKWIRI